MHKRGLSFRHYHAAVLHPDDHDRGLLVRQLYRLGLSVTCWDEPPESPQLQDIDVLFFDGDCGFKDAESIEPDWPDVPRIALVGSETPGRLEWVLARRPSAHLIKPVRSGGVYTALAMGFRQFQISRQLHAKVKDLSSRLKCRRVVFSALLKVMRSYEVDDTKAFQIIRKAAMTRRITIEQASAEIVSDERAVVDGQDDRAVRRRRA